MNSTESHGSSMDAAAAQSQPKPGTPGGVVAVVVSEPSPGKPGTGAAQTLNGSTTVVVNCHIPTGAAAATTATATDSSGNNNNSQPVVTLVNNGPVTVNISNSVGMSTAPSTIIRTSPSSSSSCSTTTSSSTTSPVGKSVPTVTLVRPPMQIPSTAVPSPAVSVTPINKTVASTGTTAAVRTPTVLQNLRTSVPSTVSAATAAPTAGIRAIAPQVLAPRLAQPQQNAPNIQNIQLPPGTCSLECLCALCNFV